MRVIVTVNCHGVDASAQGGLSLALILNRAGHDVLLQAPPGSPVSARAREMGLETSGPDLRKASIISGLLPFRRLVGRFRPDAIVTTRADGQTACALTASHIPMVRIRCDIRKPRAGRLWEFVDRRTDLVVFPSPFMPERGFAGSRRGPVAVIPHPVDTDRFAFRPVPYTSGATLVSLGRLSPMKGHRTLIRAMCLLPPDVRAVIAGPPSQQTAADLEEYAGTLGVADRISITGMVSDPVEIISAGSLGVVTSLGSEVVSRAGMEMMSSGLPLLAAATNGLLDLVRDGETGLLHSPGNHRQLASQAMFILENPALAERMGRRARKICVDEYGMEAVGERWERALDTLLRGEQNRNKKVSQVN